MIGPKEHCGDNIVADSGLGHIPTSKDLLVSEVPDSPKHPIHNHGHKNSLFRASTPVIYKVEEAVYVIEICQRDPTPITYFGTHLGSEGTAEQNMVGVFPITTAGTGSRHDGDTSGNKS